MHNENNEEDLTDLTKEAGFLELLKALEHNPSADHLLHLKSFEETKLAEIVRSQDGLERVNNVAFVKRNKEHLLSLIHNPIPLRRTDTEEIYSLFQGFSLIIKKEKTDKENFDNLLEVAEILDDLNISGCNLFFDKKASINSLFYKEIYTNTEVTSNALTMVGFMECLIDYSQKIEYQKSSTDKHKRDQFVYFIDSTRDIAYDFLTKDFEQFFTHFPHRQQLHVFLEISDYLIENMSAVEFIETFIRVYRMADFGFENIDWFIIEDVLRKLPLEQRIFNASTIPADLIKDGKITLYRGTTKSTQTQTTPLHLARSWTTNKAVACEFAFRASRAKIEDCLVYKVIVPVSQVMFYIGEQEDEVLIKPIDEEYATLTIEDYE